MAAKTKNHTFIGLLRGINVGGHHKVPMEKLRSEMKKIGCTDVTTLLNSGNMIFKAGNSHPRELRDRISAHLVEVFGFEIPALVLKAEALNRHFKEDPFQQEELNENIRFYVTFLGEVASEPPDLPFTSEDGSLRILCQKGPMLCSVLDLNILKTPDAMKILEKRYGRDITTRNWNTVKRILKKLS